MAFKLPRPGACRVCGCTQNKACRGGCYWVPENDAEDSTENFTLCSTCSGTPADIAYSVEWAARLVSAGAAAVGDILEDALTRYRARLKSEKGRP